MIVLSVCTQLMQQRMMKSHEGELVREISKLQAMVLELRAGFSRALLELNQIQLGDTELQNQLEETRHGCNKRAIHLETVVLSIREELEEVRCQIRQLCDDQVKPEQTNNNTTENDSAASSSDVKDIGHSVNGVSDVNPGVVALPLRSVGGSLLLHCYLQGLWAGHISGKDSQAKGGRLPSCSLQGRRHRIAMSLRRSEWDYVSRLGQLYDKYKSPPTTANNSDLHKSFARHVDQMLQCHLLFRNCLEERLTLDQRSLAVGDAFLKLTSQENSAFCDAYLGYISSLATILTSEFKEQPQLTQEEERESYRLLSLLFAPVSRLHTYLNTVQSLLSCLGGGHSDRRSLQDSEQLLCSLCTRCYMTLEREGQWAQGAGPMISLCSRFCAQSPNFGRSAFTKYRAKTKAETANYTNSRSDTTQYENSRSDAANCIVPSTAHGSGHQTKQCQLAVPQPLPPNAGILRNTHDRVCELLPPGGCLDGCSWRWDSPVEAGCAPVCAPTARRAQPLLLNPGKVAEFSSQNMKSPLGLAERLCGSPGLDGRVFRSDHRALDDGDTDADLQDASVFDYSSVTTCSPDDTLQLRLGAESQEEEDDEEEDSEIPVLLKPSYTQHSRMENSQSDSSVCTRWQIPRTAPIPPEVGLNGLGTGIRLKTLRRIPIGAFRPIWDAPYRQGDAAPAKESTVSFSTTNQIISPQRQTDSSRCAPDRIWNESEDSEGPCSNV
ncbi:rho guanine nucleotide exchange factor 33 [Hoplias malabaricus]|uniref:rho guanine nucleotide exchange factor 33 n=1 Tax=Hoplias malabaricus TaxID=27720 RepID=UPI0034628A85